MRCLGQGRRRQVDDDRQPRRRPVRRRQADGRPGCRRLGLLDPPHARRGGAPAGLRPAKDHPPHLAHGREDDVDPVLPGGGRPGHHVARADAAQGHPPVPRGRGLGRARLPLDRPAAGHRRCVDDARSATAAGQVPGGHHAAARRPESGQARRRDRPPLRSRHRRGGREHVRLHDAGRPALHDLRRGRRSAARGRARRPATRQDPPSGGAACGRRHR